MREKLNENPLAQVGLIGVLLVLGVLMLTSMGGGGESGSSSEAEVESSAGTSASAVSPAGETAAPSAEATPVGGLANLPKAPPPPKPVASAFDSGQTVVLLIVREGGIDDRLVKADTAALAAIPKVVLFIVPVSKIARYSAITEGVGVNR